MLRRAPSARVVVLDRAERGRDKVCGDGVAPHTLDVLSGLGVTDVVGDHPAVHRLALQLASGDSPPGVVSGSMRRPAHVVPRAELDERLLRAAEEAGAFFHRWRVRELVPLPRGVLVDGRWRARVVIGADGLHSVVRRAAGVGEQPRRHTALAIRGYAPVLPGLADEQRIVLAPGKGLAYAWSFPLGDGTANVGYGELLHPGGAAGARATPTRAGLLAALDELLPGASTGGRSWRAALLPLSSSRPRQSDGAVLLAGDAASLVNPLTGEGIYYAVLSGSLAGDAAARALTDGSDPGHRYRSRLRQTLGGHLRETAWLAPGMRLPAFVAAALRAAHRSSAVFDDLVELGLGDGRVRAATVGGLARALVTPRR